jgi:hypothetical protein
VLGQYATEEKSNEITAIPLLLTSIRHTVCHRVDWITSDRITRANPYFRTWP